MATPLEILLQVVGQADVKRALTEIGASMKTVNQETQAASGEMGQFGQSVVAGLGVGGGFALVTAAIAAVKAAIIDTSRSAVALGADIRNVNTSLGIGSEAYQVLRQEIEHTGGTVGNLTQAIMAQLRSMEMARAGTATAANAYRTLGLDLETLAQMPIQFRMEAIGRAIEGASDKNQAFGAAAEILGARNVRFLLAALHELGTDGYDKLAAQAEAAGRVMSEDTAVRLADAKRSWQEFWDWTVVKSGTFLGYLSKLKEGYLRDFWGTMSGNLPADRSLPTPSPEVVAVTPLKETVEWRQKELDLEINLDSQRVLNADHNMTEVARYEQLIPLLEQEYGIREDLVRLSETHPLSASELQTERAKLTTQLEADRLSVQARMRNEAVTRDTSRSYDALMQRYRTMNDPARNKQFMSPFEGAQAGLAEYVVSIGTIGQQIAHTIRDTIGGAVSSISSGITGLIMRTKTWGQAIQDVASSILSSLINAIVQMGVQWVATRLMTLIFGTTAKATETATTLAAATASAAAWAPAAMLASIASFGAADAAGMTGYTAAMAEAALTGWQSGGYTGDGNPADVAGFVHGSEFVFSAPATSRLGRGTLESMHAAALSPSQNPIAQGTSSRGDIGILMDPASLANFLRDHIDARIHRVTGRLPMARVAS